MIVRVDTSRCQGHGRCAMEAPRVYALDADGHCAVDGRAVAPGLEDEAQVGVEVCPERAITLEL